MYHQQERDELRAAFTGWLEIVIRNAKKNYLKKLNRQIETVPIEDVPESNLIADFEDIVGGIKLHSESAFEFEEERLSKAYAELPLMRQKILVMLFVEEKKPDEIAKQLHCTVQHVYNQRSLALKRLRAMLENGGDNV